MEELGTDLPTCLMFPQACSLIPQGSDWETLVNYHQEGSRKCGELIAEEPTVSKFWYLAHASTYYSEMERCKIMSDLGIKNSE